MTTYLITPNGNPAPNQKLIKTVSGVLFRSYGTDICLRTKTGRTYQMFVDFKDLSLTTRKYLYIFTQSKGKKDFEEKVKQGIIKPKN